MSWEGSSRSMSYKYIDDGYAEGEACENVYPLIDHCKMDSIDVTGLVTRKKRATQTMPVLRYCDHEVTDEELSLLVSTINQITSDDKEEPLYSSSFLPSGGVNPYVTRERIPHYEEDEKIYCHGYSLIHWRKLFMSLSLADPYTLQGYVDAMPYPQKQENITGLNIVNAKPRSAQSARPPPSEGRFKQIARAKNTREYIYYVGRIPREERSLSDPITPRVDGSSWREFQQEVRAWKRSLHRKYEQLTGTEPPAHIREKLSRE